MFPLFIHKEGIKGSCSAHKNSPCPSLNKRGGNDTSRPVNSNCNLMYRNFNPILITVILNYDYSD
jgi:hypothetical protein